MKTNQQEFVKRWGRLSQAALLLVVMVLMVTSAQAQTQRKPKGPKPPSYDEVLQRALEEKKSVTNAPVPTPPAPKANPTPVVAPATKPPTNNATTGSVDALLQDAKSARSQPQPASAAPPLAQEKPAGTVAAPTAAITPPTPVAQPVAQPAVQPTPVAPSSEIPKVSAVPTTTAAQPVPISATPRATKPPGNSKGPVFSPLPPDLAPTNEVPKHTLANNTSSSAESTASTNVMDALDDKHALAIGDRLSFRIVEDEEDPKPLTVMDSGELEVPYIGRFEAVGKSCKELAKALKREFEKEYYYQATVVLAVDLMAKSRGNVYFAGPGARTGTLEIPSDEVLTLSKAILRMGGFTEYADKKNVKVTRKRSGGELGVQTFTVDVEAILEGGKTEADLPLQPGDVIFVPERFLRY